MLYNSEIYAFGGSIRKKAFTKSSKYNVKSKQWKSLQDIPSPSAISSPAIWKKNILITGYELNCILSYSTVDDFYEKTSYLIESKTLKCLLQNKERIFLLTELNIYELHQATQIIHFVNKFACRCGIKKSLAYKNFIYFFDNVNVFRIDINSMAVQLIVNQNYTKSINVKEN